MIKNIYSWEFDDNKHRSPLWYILALSIVFGGSIWGFLTKQYGLSFIILLIAGLGYFVENNSESSVKVEINELGVIIAGSLYDFSNIKSFGIIYKGKEALLLRLNLSKKGIREIDMKVNNNNISDIKNILSKYIKEVPNTELTFSEKMIKILKL